MVLRSWDEGWCQDHSWDDAVLVGDCLELLLLQEVDSNQESLAFGSSFADVTRLYTFSLERFTCALSYKVFHLILGGSQNHRNPVMGLLRIPDHTLRIWAGGLYFIGSLLNDIFLLVKISEGLSQALHLTYSDYLYF